MAYDIEKFKIESERFDFEQRQAKAYIASQMIPSHLRDIGSMMILNQMSRDFDIPMLTLAQQIFIVKGKVGMSGQLAVSLINKSDAVDHGMRWEIENEGTSDWRVRAWNTIDGEQIFGEWLSDQDVTRFGWKSNPLWVSMPIRMAKYRTATYWGRDYVPDVLMGLSDKEEITDTVIMPSESQNEVKSLDMHVSASKETQKDPDGDPEATDIKTDEEIDAEIAMERLMDEADQLEIKYRKDISYPTLFKKVQAHKLKISNDELTPMDQKSFDDLKKAKALKELGIRSDDTGFEEIEFDGMMIEVNIQDYAHILKDLEQRVTAEGSVTYQNKEGA